MTRCVSHGGDAGTRLYTEEGAAFFGRSDAQSESVRPAWRETLFLAETWGPTKFISALSGERLLILLAVECVTGTYVGRGVSVRVGAVLACLALVRHEAT